MRTTSVSLQRKFMLTILAFSRERQESKKIAKPGFVDFPQEVTYIGM